MFHTGTRVVTWMDPGGYDAYRVERRFAAPAESDWVSTKAKLTGTETPNRYSLRKGNLTPAEIERVRGGGWDLPTLQRVVDQFVIHYDVCGIAKQCFNVLHDHRNLSVHFMLDLDGTIYQTLDLKERARHATISNDRSVGIEIANMGAYPPADTKALDEWYARDAQGKSYIKVPEKLGDPQFQTKNFTARPARAERVRGVVQGEDLVQYDLTPEQYAALIRLTATLAKVFPRIKLDYPRSADGTVLPHKLPDDELAKFHGVLGHFHIQTNKTDPGPAFQWDKVIDGARKLAR
jgi:N-acetyl-anhydromuramyl-L-alanine amidase AmpD